MKVLLVRFWPVLLALVWLFPGMEGIAQIGGTGSLSGVVADPSGAAVPNATIVVTNAATNAKSEQVTGSAGTYAVGALPAGVYSVKVTAPGFQTLEQQKINVDALQTATLNLTLTIGATSEVVTVTDTAPQIETSNATLGYVLRNDVYNDLPLAMNAGPRDPTAFVALVPGVQALSSQAAGTSFATFNGGQAYLNEVYIEGIPMTNAGAQGETRNLAYGVSVEAIDQFQVETNNSPAMYQGQGVENYTIRSGANHYHGALYEYFRNTVLDARGYFPTVRPVEKQNQFGGRVGGFAKRDKLFFFTDFDGYYYRSQSTPTLQTVPTLLMRQGNFSELLTPGTTCSQTTPTAGCIYDPLTTVCTNGVCTRSAFPNNIIPAARLSAVSQSLASYLPAPTSGGVQNNYLTTVPYGLHVFTSTSRVDYTVSAKQRLYGVFSIGRYSTDGVAGISANTSALPLPYTASRIVKENPMTIQVHHVYSFTSNLLNQFGYSYARLAIPILSATAGGQYPIKAGLAGLPAGQASNAFPTVNFSGTNAPQSWAGTNSQAFDEVANTYVVQDNVQWTKGRHSITAGGQFSWIQDNYTSPDDRSLATFNYAVNETSGFNAAGAIQVASGFSYASYLLGTPDSASLQDNGVKTTGARYRSPSFYAQDDFRVLPNLTLNLGVRYDIFGVFHESGNRLSFLNPTLPNPAIGGYPGALQFAGSGANSCNCSQPVKTHYFNVGPRIGLAYSPNPRTSVRAGYAMMFAHQNGAGGRAGGRNGQGQLGYNAQPTFSSLGNGAPAFFWSATANVPATYASLTNGSVPAYTKAPFFDPSLNTGYYGNVGAAGTITYGDTEIGGRAPMFHNYTGSVQQAFTNKLTLTLAYTGSQGHYLNTGIGRVIYSDQADPKYLALGALLNAPASDVNIASAQRLFPEIKKPYVNFNQATTLGRALLPFPQYTGVTDLWPAIGNSNYNALEVIGNYRAANALTMQISYTWSKLIDDVNGTGRTAYNNRLERALSAIDRKHLIQANGVWTLPLGKGRRFVSHGFLAPIVGGFQLSSLYTLSSGAPLAITSSSCQVGGIAGTLCVPNYNPSFSGPVSINGGLPSGNGNAIAGHSVPYLNVNAFSKPAAFTFGNITRSGAYGLRSPFTWNQDVTLRRTFALYEQFNLQLALSAFNVYNAVNFGGVSANIDSTAAFGTVTTQANSPRKLQVEARINF